MIILSWDVGIKNLAYCMIKKNSDTKFDILDWGVFDLSEDIQKCQFVKRGGNVCCDNARMCFYHNKNEIDKIFACIKHKEKLVPKIVNQISNKKCCNCGKNAEYNLINTNDNWNPSHPSWCSEHYLKYGSSFMKRIKTKKIASTNCNRSNIQILATKLYSKLDSFKNFLQVDEILIENQPTLKNPTMKTLSTILYSYFIIRGLIDKNKNNSTITNVRFVSPSNKLKVDQQTTNKILNKTSKQNTYKMTKKLGIKYCIALIDDKNKKKLDEHKKKDDMCDAFLQGIQYLFSPIPDILFEKLKIIGFENK